MKFADVKVACDQFGLLLLTTTSRRYIAPISVEEPTGTEDELHFFKLVLWCYVFWFEACHPAGKHIASLLRTSTPTDYKKVMDAFRAVQQLRTVRAHNMQPTSKEDEYKTTQAGLWLTTSGGEPTDWQKCCRRLCESIATSVGLLHRTWTAVTSEDDDAEIGKAQLQMAVDREWPAHRFDRLLEEAAARAGLESLDIVAYRTTRLTRWQELAKFFVDSQDAEQALRRAILRELEDIFGKEGDSEIAIPPQAPA
jgi:hypothetical protein